MLNEMIQKLQSTLDRHEWEAERLELVAVRCSLGLPVERRVVRRCTNALAEANTMLRVANHLVSLIHGSDEVVTLMEEIQVYYARIAEAAGQIQAAAPVVH